MQLACNLAELFVQGWAGLLGWLKWVLGNLLHNYRLCLFVGLFVSKEDQTGLNQ